MNQLVGAESVMAQTSEDDASNDFVHLYRYPHPFEPERVIYVGQGANRDGRHRNGKTSFGRRFQRAFPGVNLPRPVRWSVPATTVQEKNDAETAAINVYHAWRKEGGFNIGHPGSTDYRRLGEINVESGHMERMRKLISRESMAERGRIQGRKNVESGKYLRTLSLASAALSHEMRVEIGRKAVASGQLGIARTARSHESRVETARKMGLKYGHIGGRISTCLLWNIRRGKPCACGSHGDPVSKITA